MRNMPEVSVRVMMSDVRVTMNVSVVVRLCGRSGESERGRRNQRPGGKTNSTAELRIPCTPRHEHAPLYARNRPSSCSIHTHERYGDAVTAGLTRRRDIGWNCG